MCVCLEFGQLLGVGPIKYSDISVADTACSSPEVATAICTTDHVVVVCYSPRVAAVQWWL